MLDEIEAIDSYSSEVFRFVAWRQAAEVLAEMGLTVIAICATPDDERYFGVEGGG